ncbi:MAG TPA: VIT family protein [Candidatus Saccharimonadales bacterium]
MTPDTTHHNHPVPRHGGHKSHRAAWLRAAVLGADDGIVSTASLMLGVAAAHSSKQAVLTAGVAGLIAGALSMAAGEYVSVSSQRDSERADLHLERGELAANPDEELHELADIYIQRGVSTKLAWQVAKQLHAKDALAAHARDELGIEQDALANPWQAAISSATAFTGGGLIPVIIGVLCSGTAAAWTIALTSGAALAISGGIGAYIGGGSKWKAAARVFVGGGLAMALTALVGHLVGAAL